jgi:hypothetical protein
MALVSRGAPDDGHGGPTAAGRAGAWAVRGLVAGVLAAGPLAVATAGPAWAGISLFQHPLTIQIHIGNPMAGLSGSRLGDLGQTDTPAASDGVAVSGAAAPGAAAGASPAPAAVVATGPVVAPASERAAPLTPPAATHPSRWVPPAASQLVPTATAVTTAATQGAPADMSVLAASLRADPQMPGLGVSRAEAHGVMVYPDDTGEITTLDVAAAVLAGGMLLGLPAMVQLRRKVLR